MEEIICGNCGTVGIEKAIFCYQCGNQLKCKNCLEILVPGAKHCIACGISTSDYKEANGPSRNLIKLKENGAERLYEIQFSDDVGKEIKDVLADLLKNKLNNNGTGHLILPENQEALVSLPAKSDLTPAVGTSQEPGHNISAGAPEIVNPVPSDYPHLNDLEVKLECRENEWLLLYAFYLSDYGTKSFNKESVWQQYKAKRLTETRFKNLGTNWKSLFKKFLCTVKDNEYKFTAQGLDKAHQMLSMAANGLKMPHRSPRKSINIAPGNHERRLPLSRKIAGNIITADEFDVYKNEQKISLEEFFARKKPGAGNPNRIVTIAYYITKINHQEYFTEGNIDFAYRILNLHGKPVHLKQVIINLKNSRVWFQKVLDRGLNGWRLTRQAEIYVEEKLAAG